jgi:hypothetical protein
MVHRLLYDATYHLATNKETLLILQRLNERKDEAFGWGPVRISVWSLLTVLFVCVEGGGALFTLSKQILVEATTTSSSSPIINHSAIWRYVVWVINGVAI